MRAHVPLFVLAILAPFQVISTSDADCNNRLTCGNCIALAKCAWCPTIPNKDQRYQCQIANQTNWCPVQPNDPQNNIKKVSDLDLSINIPRVQIKPQKMKIKTRPGVKNVFNFDYVQAIDYPLDLYYLMDLSQSMKDDKLSLSALGNDLAKTMRKRSNNLQMGFGSFVDKRTMPFVNTFAKSGIPCVGCDPAYSFKNHLPLTEETSMFAKSVAKTNMSGNIDYPEGGFDALMQVMVCKNEINWRNNSLHMIIFSTDAESHYAGDGKLGGIVEPNDEKCHLTDGDYTHDLIQDYPSIGQIRNIASRERMNIIFAVTAGVRGTYDKLVNSISQGSTSKTGELDGKSENIVTLVEQAYDELTQSVTMKVENAKDVSVHFRSACLDGNMKDRDKCDLKQKNDQVTFEVTLEVTKCPEARTQWKQNIVISPTPSVNTLLEIELEIDCECDCEKQGNFVANSPTCSQKGDLKCGTCICNNNFWGKNCSCDAKSAGNTDDEDLSNCRQNDDDQVCSGQGICKCRQCQCSDKRYSGAFCQCDMNGCPKNANNEICSGHGTCEPCGRLCNCYPDWTGTACDCPKSKEQCTLTGKECSGNGVCECGVCKCNSIEGGGRYTGPFCEDCPTCGAGQCNALHQCVEFDVFHPEGLERPVDCINYTLHQVTDLTNEVIKEQLIGHQRAKRQIQPEVNLPGNAGEALPTPEASAASKLCSSPDKQGCTYYYKYLLTDEKILHVFAKRTKECAQPVNIIGVVAGLIGAILLAGIVMLIIWKVATSIHDRREFAKFEKERQAAMFDAGHNPLYREPASTFQNPTFNGQ